MDLRVTPVYRNLHTRVTFLRLEVEDVAVMLVLGVILLFFGQFIDREVFGLPLNVVLMLSVPGVIAPGLILFKYGRPRGYLADLLTYHTRPRVYSGLARDSEQTVAYIRQRSDRDPD
jgi:hypothetical protein